MIRELTLALLAVVALTGWYHTANKLDQLCDRHEQVLEINEQLTAELYELRQTRFDLVSR